MHRCLWGVFLLLFKQGFPARTSNSVRVCLSTGQEDMAGGLRDLHRKENPQPAKPDGQRTSFFHRGGGRRCHQGQRPLRPETQCSSGGLWEACVVG